MANVSKHFGLELRKEREKQGLSQEKLAELANIHRTHLSKIELAKISPTILVSSKLANALNVKLSELISRAEK